MKITKERLKQVILEELTAVTEGGKVQNTAKGAAMALLDAAKAMEQSPSHEPASLYAKEVAKQANLIMDMLVQMEDDEAGRHPSGAIGEGQSSLNEYEYDTQSEIYDITQHLSDAAMKLGEFSNFLQGSDERKSAQFASLSRQVKKIHDTVETHIAGIEGRKLYEKFENDQQLRDSKEDVLRQIVAQGQRAKVQGDMVDLFSAGAIVTVLDALSPENKNKFLDFPPYKMAEIAFKLLK